MACSHFFLGSLMRSFRLGTKPHTLHLGPLQIGCVTYTQSISSIAFKHPKTCCAMHALIFYCEILCLGGKPCVKTGTGLANSSLNQWPLQVRKLEVPFQIRPYFVGTFPYIALTLALYMILPPIQALKWSLLEGIASSWLAMPEKKHRLSLRT